MSRDQYPVWNNAIREAWAGNARYLLELLLRPTVEDGQGNPLGFNAIPDDAELRHAVVNVLMLGPWAGAQSLDDLMTRTGWGRGKPKLSEFEVAGARVAKAFGIAEGMAETLGVEPETLRKRIAKHKKR